MPPRLACAALTEMYNDHLRRNLGDGYESLLNEDSRDDMDDTLYNLQIHFNQEMEDLENRIKASLAGTSAPPKKAATIVHEALEMIECLEEKAQQELSNAALRDQAVSKIWALAWIYGKLTCIIDSKSWK